MNIELQTYFAKLSKRDVFQLNLAGCIDILGFLGVEDIGVLDGDIVNHTFCAMCYDAVLATSNIDIADVDVLEVWQDIPALQGQLLLLGTHMVVEVGGLEGDGCIL